MSASHSHHHHQHHGHSNARALGLALVLAALYLVVEVAAGFLTGSLALLADAGHMLSDVAALGLSLFAARLSKKAPSPRSTYGYYRTEVLAAMVNGAALIAVCIYIFIEAYDRLHRPPEVLGAAMLAVAVGGLLVNLAGLRLLGRADTQNVNIRGARLHMFTDMLGSMGAMAAGACIWAFHWYWIDPLASALIGLLVIYSAWQLLLESVAVLMESAPRGIDVDEVRNAMLALPEVAGVHDLHVWSITTGLDSLSAHVVIAAPTSHTALLNGLRTLLHERFSIEHVTIQIEPADFGSCDSHA